MVEYLERGVAGDSGGSVLLRTLGGKRSLVGSGYNIASLGQHSFRQFIQTRQSCH